MSEKQRAQIKVLVIHAMLASRLTSESSSSPEYWNQKADEITNEIQKIWTKKR